MVFCFFIIGNLQVITKPCFLGYATGINITHKRRDINLISYKTYFVLKISNRANSAKQKANSVHTAKICLFDCCPSEFFRI